MIKKFKQLYNSNYELFFGNNVNANYDKLAYDFQFKDLDGSPLNLSEYKIKLL